MRRRGRQRERGLHGRQPPRRRGCSPRRWGRHCWCSSASDRCRQRSSSTGTPRSRWLTSASSRSHSGWWWSPPCTHSATSSGNHINPAVTHRTREHREVPVDGRTGLHRGAGRRRHARRLRHRRGTRTESPARSDSAWRSSTKDSASAMRRAFFAEFIGHLHPRVRDLRRDPSQGARRALPVWPSASWCSPRSSRWHRRPRRVDQPGPRRRPDA